MGYKVDKSLTLYETAKQLSTVMVAMRSLFSTSGNKGGI